MAVAHARRRLPVTGALVVVSPSEDDGSEGSAGLQVVDGCAIAEPSGTSFVTPC